MYHTTVNSVRSRKLNFDQLLRKIMDLKAIFIMILMVLTPSRYLNWFQSYYSLNIDMSKFFTNITMTTCVVMIAQYITFSMTTCVVMIAVNWLIAEFGKFAV